jgi:hypothetical protein
VEVATCADYDRVRRYFGEWLEAPGRSPITTEEFDALGEEYVTHVYDTGKPAYHACNLVAAMELHHPLTKDRWVLTGSAAAGFRKVKHTKHRPPMPAEVAFAAAAVLWAWKRTEEADALLLGFHAYLRIGDIVTVTRKLTVLPEDDGGRVRSAVTIEDAKTGPNQTIFIDSVFVQAILRRRREAHTGEWLFPGLSEDGFRIWVGKALDRLGLSDEGYVIHSLRHGGAARDYHYGFRTPAEVQSRGRWVSERVFREYVDRGRVKLIMDRMQSKKKEAILELVKQHHGTLVGLPSIIDRFEHL